MADRDLNLELETLIKELITPIFKGIDFRKNGNNFYRELNGIGQAFNVQQSRWNTKKDKEFTFNLGLLNKETYSTIYRRELPKFPKEYDCNISIRIGQLLNKRDEWYNLNFETDFSVLKEQITSDIQNHVIPFFETFSDVKKWNEILQIEFD